MQTLSPSCEMHDEHDMSAGYTTPRMGAVGSALTPTATRMQRARPSMPAAKKWSSTALPAARSYTGIATLGCVGLDEGLGAVPSVCGRVQYEKDRPDHVLIGDMQA